ncbi:hypothetical protein SAMN02787144_1001499 [Streptomyces atratus]|uniref:Uncharacterized protein n=1 Tax=Streptomyces atratus TaxID=1893 RepID=A0A1K1UCI9_STRAR|nr:hypothetical protein SAMN02787144_1001499 [Streptomyces atratus]
MRTRTHLRLRSARRWGWILAGRGCGTGRGDDGEAGRRVPVKRRRSAAPARGVQASVRHDDQLAAHMAARALPVGVCRL